MKEWRRGYYGDYRHLDMHGTLTRPSKLLGAAVQLHFIAREVSNETSPYWEAPTDIGTLSKHRGAQEFEAYLPLPKDILSTLLPMLVTEKLLRGGVWHAVVPRRRGRPKLPVC